jgi:hypothetical protein
MHYQDGTRSSELKHTWVNEFIEHLASTMHNHYGIAYDLINVYPIVPYIVQTFNPRP